MKWEELPAMSGPRVYASVCVRNDVIYLIGGCDAMGQPVNTIEAFDTKSTTWKILPDMPTKRAAPIVELLQDKIVAVGGIGSDQLPVDSVEIFDFDKNDWVVLPRLSEPLMGMAQVLYDNKMYIFGGMAKDTNPREHLKCVELIKKGEETTSRWHAFPPMPTARYACKAFVRNDKAYVIGGRSGKIPVSAFEIYDFKTYSWTKYQDLTSQRVFQSYILTDKYILTLGGLKQDVQSAFSDGCELYDLEEEEKGSWKTNKRWSMPMKRGDFAAVCLDNKVIVIGGLGNQKYPLSNVQSFNPNNKKWSLLVDTPRPHSTSSYVISKGDIYTFGGLSKEGPSNACEVLRTKEENGCSS